MTTHQHWDHHRALADVLRATGARSAAGREDGPHLPVAPDVLLDQGDSVPVGALTLDVVHLRGHTPGSVALVLRSSRREHARLHGRQPVPRRRRQHRARTRSGSPS